MMSALSPVQQRLLAGGMLVAVLAIAWFALIAPVLTLFGSDLADGEQSARALTAYQQAAAKRPQLEARVAALQRQSADLVGAIQAPNANLAAASLQTELKKLIEQNGGEVRSAQNLQPVTADGFEKIAIRYDITLPMGSLQGLLFQIETHSPYLFVDNVDIRSPDSGNSSGANIATSKLTVRMDVEGYRWAGAS